jgi:hypothetical protein
MRRYLIGFILLSSLNTSAQSFIGLPGSYYGVQRLSANPAFVNTCTNGTEIHALSFSALAGSNAVSFSLTGEQSIGANGDTDFQREPGKVNRHVWNNIDVLGPAASFQIKGKYQVGFYTRYREIMRAGGISTQLFGLVEHARPASFDTVVSISNAGVGVQSFGEVGVTYGRVLLDDYYRKFTIGVSLKYMIGYMAASVAMPKGTFRQNSTDSINAGTGDINVMYTMQANELFAGGTPPLFYRTGKGSLGLDVGVTYEYHPDGNPNSETPYLYRVAASITDIGGITYRADTGSGQYQMVAKNRTDAQLRKQEGQRLVDYIGALMSDTLIARKREARDFRVGLPTALRLNGDVSIGGPLWLSADILLNLRKPGGESYTPCYVNQLYLTPRIDFGKVSLGIPFGFVGYQTATVGAVVRLGPLVIGSGSAISAMLAKRLRAADAYLGLAFKVPQKKTAW